MVTFGLLWEYLQIIHCVIYRDIWAIAQWCVHWKFRFGSLLLVDKASLKWRKLEIFIVLDLMWSWGVNKVYLRCDTVRTNHDLRNGRISLASIQRYACITTKWWSIEVNRHDIFLELTIVNCESVTNLEGPVLKNWPYWNIIFIHCHNYPNSMDDNELTNHTLFAIGKNEKLLNIRVLRARANRLHKLTWRTVVLGVPTHQHSISASFHSQHIPIRREIIIIHGIEGIVSIR